MRSMARAPKFNDPQYTPPASGWKPATRAPALGYGQLDGTAFGDLTANYNDVGQHEVDCLTDSAQRRIDRLDSEQGHRNDGGPYTRADSYSRSRRENT